MSMNMTKIPQPGLSQTQPLLMQVRRFAVLIS